MSTSNLTASSTIIKAVYVYDDGIAIPYIVRFWMFLISNICSILCAVFVLYHCLGDSTLRHGLHYHISIVMLIICLIYDFTDVPFQMYLFLYRVVWIQTPTFCLTWKILDAALYTSTAKLIGWASVERHILIFHENWIATRRRRFFIHYTPIILIVTYGVVLYSIITPINYCKRPFYYFMAMCGYYSCVYDSATFTLYEYATGGLLCSVLIGFGGSSLILRVVLQKRRLRRHINWRKHRKMAIQLLSITALFYIFYLPPVLVGTARRVGFSSSAASTYSTYASFFTNYIVFLFPFACLNTLPNLRTRVRNMFEYLLRRKIGRIIPATNTRIRQD
ncbi:unnamed protein product [Adineta ricciae]|uniref:G-protein coupled receptors family 1 profile domain-containing protein n=2 Tax=Adineta ricciae TaxID=249248 RepID=A0A814VL47_ADIRI|nr:unnamed protein product [Adineta ricciae]